MGLWALAMLWMVGGGADTAGEAAPEPPPVYETATVLARARASATASVTVLDRDQIDALGVASLDELLTFIPGVAITAGGGGGAFANARIRGGDPNYTLVLIDGVPVCNSTYQVGDVYNLAGFPLASLERIEVVRGPLSSFFGSTGLAGVINLVTARGQGVSKGADISAEGGTASLARARVAWSGNLPAGGFYHLALTGESESERIAAERYRLAGFDGSLGLPLTPRIFLDLRARLADWESDDYPEASGGPLFGSGALRHGENREWSLSAALSLGRDRHQRLGLAHARHDLDRTSPAIVPAVPPGSEDTVFTNTRLYWHARLAADTRWDVNLGADLTRERGENTSLLSLPDFLGGDVRGDYILDRARGGVFAEWLVRPGRWLIELSGRLDLLEDHGARWSPRLGFSRAAGAVRFFGSAGQAFKLPSFFASASPRQLGGNPDLRPEKAESAELGLELSPNDDVPRLGLTAFHTRYEDLIDFDFASFLHVNRGDVRALGVEAYTNWDPAPGIAIRLNLTYQDVRDRATDTRLRNRPYWYGGGSLAWSPHEDWRLSLRLRSTGGSLDEQIPVPERTVAPGYTLAAMTARWSFAPGWRAHLAVDNLFDREHETYIGFPGSGRSWRAGLAFSGR